MIPLDIVIPVYNEKDNIVRTLEDIRRWVSPGYRIRVVYDFDEDDTLPAVCDYREKNPGFPVALLRNDIGRGVVNAIKKGLQTAADGAVLVVMADSSDDLRSVEPMRLKIEEGFDVVCGSRYMTGGRQEGGPWLKGFLSRMAGLSLRFLTGIPTHDITNSFKMYSARLLRRLRLESTGGFEVGLEILVKCFAGGGRITEIPTVWRDRAAGESRFRLWQWLPHYLKWYFYALRYRWLGQAG